MMSCHDYPLQQSQLPWKRKKWELLYLHLEIIFTTPKNLWKTSIPLLAWINILGHFPSL